MKIKLAILEKDQCYLNRIVSTFSSKYADNFEIYSFTDPVIALDTIDNAKIDVLIADEIFDIDVTKISRRCGFAYFVDDKSIDTLNNQIAICKFQKAELIYKQILSIYSETAANVSGLTSNDNTIIVAFSSPCGGVGTSSMAVACACNYAAKGKKTLYLSLEKYGSSDCFFSGDGQFDMSDIIYALKSKKSNLSIKLESCVKQDASGVYFYSQSKIALDMLELNTDDLLRLVTELKLIGSYDYIILDMDFSLDEGTMNLYRQAHAMVMVSDGTEVANSKLFRAYTAMSVKEQNEVAPLTSRLCLVYNKFSNKSSRVIENIDIRNIGGAPRFEHASVAQVRAELSTMNIFEKI